MKIGVRAEDDGVLELLVHCVQRRCDRYLVTVDIQLSHVELAIRISKQILKINASSCYLQKMPTL